MASAASYRGILKVFDSSPSEVRQYFSELPHLLRDNYPYDITIAYLFMRTELAHNRALYCGVVKLYKINAEIAANVIARQHLSRDGFLGLYAAVFREPMPDVIRKTLAAAQSTRDRVIHGKAVPDPTLRQAIVDVLEYAIGLNQELERIAGFKPFGDLRGFKGRAKLIEKEPSRLLLKGLGFSVS